MNVCVYTAASFMMFKRSTDHSTQTVVDRIAFGTSDGRIAKHAWLSNKALGLAVPE